MHLLFTLIFAVLSFFPHSNQSQATTDSAEPRMAFRIVVEPGSSDSLAMIETLRRSGHEYGVDVSFGSTTGERHDVRILTTVGDGSQSNPFSNDMSPVTFSFCSASVLSPDGTLLFSVTHSAPTRSGAIHVAARDIIKKLYARYRSLKSDQGAAASRNPTQTRVDDSAGKSQRDTRSSPRESVEPGVYYRNGGRLIRLQEPAGATIKTEGSGAALLTFGLSGLRTIEVYPGDQSLLQITDSKPVFTVRGVAVSPFTSTIVKLKKRSTRREAEISFMSTRGIRSGYRSEDLRKVSVQRQSEDVVGLLPEAALEPGEYILLLDGLAYEFGVSKK